MSLPPSFFDHLADRLELAVYDTNCEIRMGAIDRIKEKALQARSIAPDAIKAFEADLDALIAEGPKLAAAQKTAVGAHQEAFAGIRGEFAGLQSAIDILSNGEPSPLDDSKSSAPPSGQSSPPAVASTTTNGGFPDLNQAGVIPEKTNG